MGCAAVSTKDAAAVPSAAPVTAPDIVADVPLDGVLGSLTGLDMLDAVPVGMLAVPAICAWLDPVMLLAVGCAAVPVKDAAAAWLAGLAVPAICAWLDPVIPLALAAAAPPIAPPAAAAAIVAAVPGWLVPVATGLPAAAAPVTAPDILAVVPLDGVLDALTGLDMLEVGCAAWCGLASGCV